MLEVVFTNKKPVNNDIRVVCMFEGSDTEIDFLTQDEAGLVEKAVSQSDFEGRFGESCMVYGGNEKILLFGLGKKQDELSIQSVAEKLFAILFDKEDAYIAVDNEDTAINLAYGILMASYSFDKYKTEKKAEEYTRLERICFRVKNEADASERFKPYIALVNGIRYCKDLCNEPASYLTPEVFAQDIKRLEYLGLDVEILEAKDLTIKGLGLIEAVGKGSANSPKAVVIKWIGNRAEKRYDLGLVGKGVCFDAGGLSLKSTAGMTEMKMDMFGAAAVAATMKVVALQRLRKNIVAVLGLVENLPSASAMKIGDVYTSYCGKTVEVINADAEGRMVVADCLAYLQANYAVENVVDITTLGSLRTALGNVYAGLFANDDGLASDLIKAGNCCGEKLWQMPLDEKYAKMLSSQIADLKNLPQGETASVASAEFLHAFVNENVKWAHIDMSGMRIDKGGLASGFGVRLLNEFVKGL